MRDYAVEWKRGLYVVIYVTTRCQRNCPLCCVNHFRLKKQITDSPERVAQYIKTIGRSPWRFCLAGGEPTLHPQFREMLLAAREVTPPGRLFILTNGARLVEYAEDTALVDGVVLSVYTKESNAGAAPTNELVASEYTKVRPSGTWFESGPVHHVAPSGKTGTCCRYPGTIGVVDGRVYPCCACTGEGTPLTQGWEARVQDLYPACAECALAT